MNNNSGNSALANLTATYTDSENEEENSDEQSPHSELSQESQIPHIQSIKPKSSYTPIRKSPQPAKIAPGNSALRLVDVYHDETAVSDDENVNQEETINMEISEEEEEEIKPIEQEELDHSKDKYAHYGFSLPPVPKGKVPPELTEKIRSLYEKMETNNMDMNKIIQERKEFRNPSIYEKLIQFCDINEFGTNYPPEIYDPLQWGSESFYEELAKVQKTEMLKRQKEKKDNDKADIVAAAAKKAEEEAKRRKSKWDQPAPVPSSGIKTNIPPPTFTSNITGTKGTVISAFGSLPKKLSM